MCLSVFVFGTFVIFTDCESFAKPISSNPGSVEVGEYELTHETCFIARSLEVVAGAGLLWISWCVLDGADCFVFRFSVCFFLVTHMVCCKYEAPCRIHLTTSNDAVFAGRQKASSYRGAYRVSLFN